jgi:disulfide bond formation protein DsbB
MRKRLTILVIAGAMILAACGGSDSSDDGDSGSATTAPAVAAGDAARGAELYVGSCEACHGPGGVGVEGLGKPWVDSVFIGGQTDAGLIAFIKVGRDVDDPENTTGIIMPAKGGNPALSDEDIADIVAYMRTIN